MYVVHIVYNAMRMHEYLKQRTLSLLMHVPVYNRIYSTKKPLQK